MGTAGTAGGQMQDHTFMMKAAEGGMAEVQLGQLAQQNGQSQAVKDFGKRMVDDHTKANDQLKQIATQQGVSLPSSPSSHDQAEYNKLSKLQGDAFDKAYAKMMVSDHKKDIAEFQREANAGSNADVKGFASQTLPTLQEHLKMAEKMNSEIRGKRIERELVAAIKLSGKLGCSPLAGWGFSFSLKKTQTSHENPHPAKLAEWGTRDFVE